MLTECREHKTLYLASVLSRPWQRSVKKQKRQVEQPLKLMGENEPYVTVGKFFKQDIGECSSAHYGGIFEKKDIYN